MQVNPFNFVSVLTCLSSAQKCVLADESVLHEHSLE